MNKRKRIGVIACDLIDEFHTNTVQSICDCANAYDVDILFFTTFIVGQTDNQYLAGEVSIYSLIDFSDLDGVIFFEDSFKNIHHLDDIFTLLEKKCKVPVCVIGNGRGIYESFHFVGRKAVEELTDHFIEKHGYKKIYCLTGPKDLQVTQERLDGYYDSMRKHGIPVPDSYIIEGDFWSQYAEKLADDIAFGRIEKPEAVVCLNDCMAIFLTNRLIANGVEVPDDLAICGFDHIPESERNIPSITTYFPAEYSVAEQATRYVLGKIFGKDLLSGYSANNGHVDVRKSCGCSLDEKRLQIQYKAYLEQHHLSGMFQNSFMEESIYNASDIRDLVNRINNFTYLIKDLDCYSLCLCENWDYIDSGTDASTCGYSKKRTVTMLKYFDDHVETPFNVIESIVPMIDEDRDYATSYYITPLHFNEHCFGYSVITFGRKHIVYSNIYRLWNKCIDNALELTASKEKLYISSIKDALTGLYNRRGFDERAQMLFKTALETGKNIFVVGGDLDLLKYINDNFGHLEGDSAITVASKAIQSACLGDEICARTGGDEFSIMGIGDYTRDDFEKFKGRVHKYVDDYNSSHDFQYKIGISLGAYVGPPDVNVPMEKVMTIADNEMYRDKCIRKGGRRRDDFRK